MILRMAKAEDAPGMARVLGDWVRETGWMPVLHGWDADLGFCRHLLAGQAVHVLDDGVVAGFLARDGAVVTCLYLAPRARGQGWGASLLTMAMAATDRLELWTFQANPGAIAFYVRNGFATLEQGDGTGNDEGLPDFRLEWRRKGVQ